MKAAQFHQRLIAKGIDFFLVLYVCSAEQAFWVIASIIYLLVCDSFFEGQSIGKRLVGLKTLYMDDETKKYERATYVQSAIRNSGFALAVLLGIIPFVGIVFKILGCLLVFIEIYFMYSDAERMRIGDIYAKTKVVQVHIS
jgi:uncharacterized RDD family membrane protein YckC